MVWKYWTVGIGGAGGNGEAQQRRLLSVTIPFARPPICINLCNTDHRKYKTVNFPTIYFRFFLHTFFKLLQNSRSLEFHIKISLITKRPFRDSNFGTENIGSQNFLESLVQFCAIVVLFESLNGNDIVSILYRVWRNIPTLEWSRDWKINTPDFVTPCIL